MPELGVASKDDVKTPSEVDRNLFSTVTKNVTSVLRMEMSSFTEQAGKHELE